MGHFVPAASQQPTNHPTNLHHDIQGACSGMMRTLTVLQPASVLHSRSFEGDNLKSGIPPQTRALAFFLKILPRWARDERCRRRCCCCYSCSYFRTVHTALFVLLLLPAFSIGNFVDLSLNSVRICVDLARFATTTYRKKTVHPSPATRIPTALHTCTTKVFFFTRCDTFTDGLRRRF